MFVWGGFLHQGDVPSREPTGLPSESRWVPITVPDDRDPYIVR